MIFADSWLRPRAANLARRGVLRQALSPSFIKGLRTHFPRTHLTFDCFYVMQMINKAVDDLRRGVAKDRRDLKKTGHIWLKNASNLWANRVARLQELRVANLLTAEVTG